MLYATLDEFKTWIGSHTTDDDHHLEPVLLAAMKAVDDECGRSFAYAPAQTRYVYPSDASRVPLVDLIAATSVSHDTSGNRTFATLIEPTDYELLPYADAKGHPSERYQELRLWPQASTSLSPHQLVRVIGDWGYQEVPQDVRLATLLLASRYWKRHEAPLGILEATDLGTFQRISQTDPDVCTLLQDYSRVAGAGAGWVVV